MPKVDSVTGRYFRYLHLKRSRNIVINGVLFLDIKTAHLWLKVRDMKNVVTLTIPPRPSPMQPLNVLIAVQVK